MTCAKTHISVCICTYKRRQYLTRLLRDLQNQITRGAFSYSIVVADNDPQRSAEAIVAEVARGSTLKIDYCVQPQQNIALTRNKAIEIATGDYIAFIDDDEFPGEDWLITLYTACTTDKVDGALGPVKPYFNEDTPQWVIKGKFWERPTYSTGLVIDWQKGRTGNVLFHRRILKGESQPFRPQFLEGSDQDFFRRMIDKGHVFIWCNEAVAYEVVPPVRCKRSFLMRRALLRGATNLLHPSFGRRHVIKAIVAVPAYALALPVALLLGQHRFVNLLIKLCDHLGRLMALVGFRPVKQAYVTE